MEHVYVTDEDRLYSFAPSSVVTLDGPRPRPSHTIRADAARVRVVAGEPVFYAGIAITNLCNLTCKHCPVSVTTTGARRRQWDVGRFDAMVCDLVSRGLTRVSITGGEPFLHSDIEGIFEVLASHGIESKINTNGLLADPDLVARLVTRGLIEIDVSINDPQDDTDSYLRARDYAGARIDAVRRLVSRLGSSITITASSVLTRRLLGRLEATEHELSAAGVGRWRLREMLPNLDREPDDSLVPSLAEVTAALAQFAERPRELLVYGYLIDAVRGVPAGRRCRNLEKHYAYVSYDGQCWWMAGLTGAPLGDLTTGDAAQLSARLRTYRNEMDLPVRCGTCPARFICSESPHKTDA
jgi:MoaA/NifB/PqqE/SkfB family radical SAM enzyme